MKKEILKEIRRGNRRLNIIKEEINLGTLDTTILTLMIFFIALGVTLISLASSETIKNPLLLIPYLYVILLVFPVGVSLYVYVSSIISQKSKFNSKVFALTYLGFNVTIVLLALLFTLGIFFYEMKKGVINSPYFGQIIGVIIILLSIFISIFYVHPKTKRYFLENYPCMFARRIRKMNRKDRKKIFKRYKTSSSEVKKLSNLEKD